MHDELADLEQLEEAGLLSDVQIIRKTNLITELLKINEKEEIYWQQRSHDKQLKEGDNNTENFHRMANGRKRRNIIVSTEDGDKTIEGDAELLSHATNYYKSLFGQDICSPFPLDPSLCMQKKKWEMMRTMC